MLSPLPRHSNWWYCLLFHPVVSTFPESVVGSACALSFSRLAQRSLTLRPAHSRCHQFVTRFTRRLQPFRCLHSCSGCFRLELIGRVGFAPTGKAPPLHGAHTCADSLLLAHSSVCGYKNQLNLVIAISFDYVTQCLTKPLSSKPTNDLTRVSQAMPASIRNYADEHRIILQKQIVYGVIQPTSAFI